MRNALRRDHRREWSVVANGKAGGLLVTIAERSLTGTTAAVSTTPPVDGFWKPFVVPQQCGARTEVVGEDAKGGLLGPRSCCVEPMPAAGAETNRLQEFL